MSRKLDRQEIKKRAFELFEERFKNVGCDNWLCNLYLCYTNEYMTSECCFVRECGDLVAGFEPFEREIIEQCFYNLITTFATIGALNPEKTYIEVSELILAIRA